VREPFLEFVEEKLGGDFVLIACGLPGTWKTETTQEVARIKGYPMLRSDIIRLEVLKGEDIFDGQVASNMDKRTAVYEEVFRQAYQALHESEGVILDATFVSQSLRRRAAEIAAEHDRRFVILQTHCPQEVAIGRILRRTREDYQSNALTEEAYLNNKRRFEEVDLQGLLAACPGLRIVHMVVDTASDAPQDWYVINYTEK